MHEIIQPADSGERTIGDLLRTHAAARPEASAISALGRPSATYTGLVERIDEVRSVLKGCGIRPGDAVAVALSNRADMAVAMLAVVDCAICVPLDPNVRAEEFRAVLDDVRPRVVILESGTDTPGSRGAQEGGIPVIELVRDESAGVACFSLVPQSPATDENADQGTVLPADTAFLLRTSGTTGEPSWIPWEHGQFVRQACVQAEWLQLTAEDCGISIMPMHHGAAINSALLMPLSQGGSIVCLEAFSPENFFGAISAFRPTWYTAGAAYQQEILRCSDQFKSVVGGARIRFIRSGSGRLHKKVQLGLETLFDAPVVQRYGLTETIGTVTCNPLPPGLRKTETVGVPVGCEIAIMDDNWRQLATGQDGEIAVRGPSVVTASRAGTAVHGDGWLRTGDVGHVDADGYLTITGRTKEVINRGGEKILPVEIESALMRHPDVIDAAAFSIPHRSLGEIVGAALVLAPNAITDVKDLAVFLKDCLHPIKRPSDYMLLDEIPRSPLRKIKRDELSALYAERSVDRGKRKTESV